MPAVGNHGPNPDKPARVIAEPPATARARQVPTPGGRDTDSQNPNGHRADLARSLRLPPGLPMSSPAPRSLTYITAAAALRRRGQPHRKCQTPVLYSVQLPVKEAHDAVSDFRPQHRHRPGRRAVRIGTAAFR